MTSHSLVPQSPALRLPVAQMRNVFHPGDVERKLARLQESGNQREYETLRTVYERMLERGPERFQVKPSGVPDMASLYEQLPNFTEVLHDVKRHVALAQDSSDGLEVTPMLLLGPPGIGKTHFARHLAELLGTGMNLLPMSSMTAGWLLSGSSAQWKGARPGKVFEALVEGEYANPVIVVDEIDKASSDAQYDPLGALYSLLEYDTAQSFTDEFAEVAIDASQVIWITTANDTRGIPDPILNRMNVFEVEAPTLDQARTIARNLYQGIRAGHDWGRLIDPEPLDDVLDDVKRHVALAQDSSDGLEVTPMLLLGPPGIGKTHFARHLAELLGTGMNLLPMSSMTAGWLLSGSSAQWKGARPGKVFEALVEGEYANPVIVVDEIDKASGDAQYAPLGALYSLLEHDTAQSFTDEFAEVAIDASQVIWITTANDARGIPDPILNRMNVFEVEAPTLEQARTIALNLYQGIRNSHDWGRLLDPEPQDDVLEHLAHMPPREMRRALMTGFGNARLDRRSTVEITDLPKAANARGRIGFVQ